MSGDFKISRIWGGGGANGTGQWKEKFEGKCSGGRHIGMGETASGLPGSPLGLNAPQSLRDHPRLGNTPPPWWGDERILISHPLRTSSGGWHSLRHLCLCGILLTRPCSIIVHRSLPRLRGPVCHRRQPGECLLSRRCCSTLTAPSPTHTTLPSRPQTRCVSPKHRRALPCAMLALGNMQTWLTDVASWATGSAQQWSPRDNARGVPRRDEVALDYDPPFPHSPSPISNSPLPSAHRVFSTLIPLKYSFPCSHHASLRFQSPSSAIICLLSLPGRLTRPRGAGIRRPCASPVTAAWSPPPRQTLPVTSPASVPNSER